MKQQTISYRVYTSKDVKDLDVIPFKDYMSGSIEDVKGRMRELKIRATQKGFKETSGLYIREKSLTSTRFIFWDKDKWQYTYAEFLIDGVGVKKEYARRPGDHRYDGLD